MAPLGSAGVSEGSFRPRQLAPGVGRPMRAATLGRWPLEVEAAATPGLREGTVAGRRAAPAPAGAASPMVPMSVSAALASNNSRDFIPQTSPRQIPAKSDDAHPPTVRGQTSIPESL